MFKKTLKGMSVILGAMFLFGCASSKGVEMRRYVEIRDRVDQNMEGGNVGYLSGTAQPEDRSGFRKTRKVYVLEVSQGESLKDETALDMEDGLNENNAVDDEFIFEGGDARGVPAYSPQRPYDGDTSENDMEDEDSVPSPSVVEYTVQKDDTLQKISKKFYDSFSKWTKIYDVNRNVIDNPDQIKPGTVIQVPVE